MKIVEIITISIAAICISSAYATWPNDNFRPPDLSLARTVRFQPRRPNADRIGCALCPPKHHRNSLGDSKKADRYWCAPSARETRSLRGNVSPYVRRSEIRRQIMKKWMVGIATAVLAGVLTWWLTEGLRSHPTPPTMYSVSGFWKYKLTSEVSGNTTRRSLTLTQDSTTVSGVLESTFDNSKSGVKGTFVGNSLELSRDTGMDTVQNYRLTKENDNKLVGTFDNVVKWPDRGTFEIER